jgi:hypothetical protein
MAVFREAPSRRTPFTATEPISIPMEQPDMEIFLWVFFVFFIN